MAVQVEHACAEILARVEKTLYSIRAIIERLRPPVPRGLLNALCLGVLRNYVLLEEALRYCGYRGPTRGGWRGWLALVVAYEAVFRRTSVDAARLRRIAPRIPGDTISCLYSIGVEDVANRYSGLRRLAVKYSVPLWVVEKLAETNPPGGVEALLEGFQKPTPVWIRFNRRLLGLEEALRELEQKGVRARPDPVLDDVVEAISIRPGALEALDKKKYYVHDRSAALVAHVLGDVMGYGVDMFSAPGNKIAHLSWRRPVLGVALDVSARRLRDEKQLHRQQGVWVYDLVEADARHPPLREGLHWALVDPDCSSMGRLGHSPETRLFLEKAGPLIVKRLARLQYQGLREALLRLRPGAIAVYTTCTLTIDENEGVVKRVVEEGLAEVEEAKPVIGYQGLVPGTQRIAPHVSRCTGGFVARLRRV